MLVCLSKCYLEKLASPSLVDQCKKEFNHILSQRGESGMIMPVVIEEFTPTAAGSLAKPLLLAPPTQQPPRLHSLVKALVIERFVFKGWPTRQNTIAYLILVGLIVKMTPTRTRFFSSTHGLRQLPS